MTALQYWPFFLTALIPTLGILIGFMVNKSDTTEIKSQVTHLIDLHINHAERIAWLEAKSGKH
jgi:hypothetical protein